MFLTDTRNVFFQSNLFASPSWVNYLIRLYVLHHTHRRHHQLHPRGRIFHRLHDCDIRGLKENKQLHLFDCLSCEWLNLILKNSWRELTFRVFRAERAASSAGMASARSLSHSFFRAWAAFALIVAASSSTRTTLLLASTWTDSTSITWKS